MSEKELTILAELNRVFGTVLQDESIELSPTDSAKTIDLWDSINHMTLIIEVQKTFNVKFSLRETMTLNKVEDFISLIMKK